MTHARLHTYTGGLTLLVVALAVLNWAIAPENTAASIAAIVTMVVIWGVVAVKTKLAARAPLSGAEQSFFIAAVIFAGLLLALSLAAKFLDQAYGIDASLLKRGRNVFVGIGLLYFANLMPKMIGPSLKGKCSNVAANAVRRFSGWALALGAIGYIGAWIFAPISLASTLAQIFVGGAVILVILRVLFVLLRNRQPTG